MVTDLFSGNKVFVAYELHVLLAFGAEFNTVGGGAVFVAFVNGANGRFHGSVPLGDQFFFLFGWQVLSIQPRPEGCFGGLHGGKRFSGGANHNGVLARNIDDAFGLVLFVGTMDNHVRTDGGKYHRQDYNRDDDND